jgi:hypothetical protein
MDTTNKLTKIGNELGFKKGIFSGKLKRKLQNLERDWEVIQTEVMEIIPDAKMAVDTAKPLIEKITSSIRKIREELQRNHRSGRTSSSGRRSTRSRRGRSSGRSNYSEMKKAS